MLSLDKRLAIFVAACLALPTSVASAQTADTVLDSPSLRQDRRRRRQSSESFYDSLLCSLSNHAFPHRSESKSGLHHFLMPLSFSRFFSSLMNSCTSLKSMYTDAKRTYATLSSVFSSSMISSPISVVVSSRSVAS